MFGAVDVRTIAMLSGPLVGAGYFIGSVQWRILHRRWQLRVGEPDANDALSDTQASGREGEGVVAAVEALAPVAYALAVWQLIELIAPGGRGGFNASSLVGALSNQVLPVWQSLAAWCGAAAVLGHVAPVWTRFRGGTGLPPAMALTLVFAPWLFVSAVAAFLGSFWFTRNRRPALLVAFSTAVTYSWLGWVFTWNRGWGVNFGPELALWTAVLMAMLTPRLLFSDEYQDDGDPLLG
jgi:hypothetical protein